MASSSFALPAGPGSSRSPKAGVDARFGAGLAVRGVLGSRRAWGWRGRGDQSVSTHPDETAQVSLDEGDLPSIWFGVWCLEPIVSSGEVA